MKDKLNFPAALRAELPLIIMAVLEPLVVGTLITTRLTGLNTPAVNLWLLGLTAVAAGAAFLHLNQPWRFYTALRNFTRSWLSREALAFGGFATLLGLLYLAQREIISPAAAAPLAQAAMLAGIAALAATGAIYRLPHRPAWYHWTQSAGLFTAAASFGPVLTWLLVPAARLPWPLIPLRLATLAALLLGFSLWWLRLSAFGQLSAETKLTHHLLLTPGRRFTLARLGLGFFLPALFLVFDFNPALSHTLALTGMLLGELLERGLFFATVVPAPLPAAGDRLQTEIDPWTPAMNPGSIPLGSPADYAPPAILADGETKIIPTTCVNNCGGKCVLLAHVKDGVIVHLTTDNTSDDASLISPQLRACAKGRAYLKRVYHPERLRWPLKRVGERGEAKFVRISWEEALDTVAREMQRVKDTYGDAAILDLSRSGAFGGKLHQLTVDRFLNQFGCRTVLFGSYSCETTDIITEHMCGTCLTGNDRADLLNSNLIILWGFSPAEGVRGTNTSWFVARAREQGTKVVAIDPVCTDSASILADQWIPIRPGTDSALMVAMAYCILEANLHDQSFLDRFTHGFETFAAYVRGESDGIPKTPAWAEAITGVPATTTRDLALSYAQAKPGALLCGWSLQRTAYGEQPVRLAITLAAMTGNIGIPGGNTGGVDYSRVPSIPGLPIPPDPNPAARVPVYVWADLILRGKAGGYPSDIKMIYMVGGNLLNQGANVHKNIEAFRQAEFIVCHEQFMTPTAKYSDIILPANTFLERNDICFPGTQQGNYLLYANKVIDSLYESKSDYEIFAALAERLGFGDTFTEGKSEEDWLREFAAAAGIKDYDEFKRTGIYRDKRKKPYIAFTEQIQKGKPFATPSGKIEIYSERLAELNDPEIPAIPRHIDPWEGPADPLAQKYPLQLVTAHSKQRVHSSHDNNPYPRAIQPHQVWINAADAARRGIKDGDPVRVYNDRGAIILAAKVTGRIMPGVVNVHQGAWFSPDASGQDRGANTNVLNLDRPTPYARASTTHTTLVEVAAAPENERWIS